MLFQTWEFVIFFTIVMAVYVPLLRTRWWQLWLWLTSYVFYGWWNPLFLVLIFYSTAVDYLIGRRIGMAPNTAGSRRWLTLAILNNLFMLGFFKYAGFFAQNLRTLFEILHIPLTVPEPNILLPVGISFFTFQSMSYLIDVYRGKLRAEPQFIRFAAFVAMFQQLVAGPIERGTNILKQVRHAPVIRSLDVSDGISLFIVGLFKKVVMADSLSLYVDKVYGDPGAYSWLALLFATYGFAWQIYFDFSGYTDMARGIAKTMGLRLMLNFNNPYTAVDLSDFWRRWHISLSSWFRDYVYIPLGGGRGVFYLVYWNVFLTMLISGFWHGAAWTFIVWGALNGLGAAATRNVEKQNWYLKLPQLLKQALVFNFICVTWVFFRAQGMGDAMLVLKRICTGAAGAAEVPLVFFLMVAVVWLYQLIFNSSRKIWLESLPLRAGAMTAAIMLILIFSSSASKQFIYFQF